MTRTPEGGAKKITNVMKILSFFFNNQVSEFQSGFRVSRFATGPLSKHPIMAHSCDGWTKMGCLGKVPVANLETNSETQLNSETELLFI